MSFLPLSRRKTGAVTGCEPTPGWRQISPDLQTIGRISRLEDTCQLARHLVDVDYHKACASHGLCSHVL